MMKMMGAGAGVEDTTTHTADNINNNNMVAVVNDNVSDSLQYCLNY